MDNETEVMIENAPAELVQVVQSTGVGVATAESLQFSFGPFFGQAKELIASASLIVVKDETDAESMKQAREHRLKLRAVRVEVENTRKKLKEDSLRKGKAIDGLANVLKYLIEPVESHLMEQEQFAERAKAARSAALKEERVAALRAYEFDGAFMNLGDMPAEQWQALLDNTRVAFESRKEIARKVAEEARILAEKAEAERIAREKKEAEERKRIAAENARLKKEAEAREAALAEERRKAKEAADRLKAAELEAAKAKAEEEAKAERARAEEEAKAKAPDREKFKLLLIDVRRLHVPQMNTEAAEAVAVEIREKVGQFARWIEKKVDAL